MAGSIEVRVSSSSTAKAFAAAAPDSQSSADAFMPLPRVPPPSAAVAGNGAAGTLAGQQPEGLKEEAIAPPTVPMLSSRERITTADTEPFRARNGEASVDGHRSSVATGSTTKSARHVTLAPSVTDEDARAGHRRVSTPMQTTATDFVKSLAAAGRKSCAAPAQEPIELEEEEEEGLETELSPDHTSCEDEEETTSGEEDMEEPPRFEVKRRGGVSAEASGQYNKRFAEWTPECFEKTHEQRVQIIKALRAFPILSKIGNETAEALASVIELEVFEEGQRIMRQGEVGRSGYVLLEGKIDVYVLADGPDGARSPSKDRATSSTSGVKGDRVTPEAAKDPIGDFRRQMTAPRFFGEHTMLWGFRRGASAYAHDRCVVGKLKRDTFFNLVSRREMEKRSMRENYLRGVRMFETLNEEQIAKIADALKKRKYATGQHIVRQDEVGSEFFVVIEGECAATVQTGTDDLQEHRRYYRGDVFGERGFIYGHARAASVIAKKPVKVLCLSTKDFERMLGPLEHLHAEHYMLDPRKVISDFYRSGDQRGPRGVCQGEPVDETKKTEWFAVYRPTSRDAIAKMLGGTAVGKGLNVKGKSSKKNHLSGFVPFLQISKDEHKDQIEDSPPDARLQIFFQTKGSRDIALADLEEVIDHEAGLELEGDPTVELIDDFQGVYGLEVHERVVREVYIKRQSMAFLIGWDTGRASEPAFMDMNLHAVREATEPRVVLYQLDVQNPLNPHGLLIAYAEALIKPVVSDFDTFTVGSKNMLYETLPRVQQELAMWSLEQTEQILGKPGTIAWNSRWLEVLTQAKEKGFHPEVPKYGFGDSTSYRLIEGITVATKDCGAVRHGSECFNFSFPQEMDPEYLVIWDGFDEKPWRYKDPAELRDFMLDRIKDGYSFPLNPVWPVRDPGWYDVYGALKASPTARQPMKAWYPPESGIAEKIEAIHEAFPSGFAIKRSPSVRQLGTSSMSSGMTSELDGCEQADLAEFVTWSRDPANMRAAAGALAWRKKVQQKTKAMLFCAEFSRGEDEEGGSDLPLNS